MERTDLILELIKQLREDGVRRHEALERKLDVRHESIEKKLDDLSAFRWKAVGGSLAISAVLAFAFNVLHTIIK